MEELRLDQTTGHWRVFIDSSKVSLKAVLLHSGNKFHCIPLAPAVHMNEMYKNLQVLLQKLCCEEHGWDICADLKVIVFLTVARQIH